MVNFCSLYHYYLFSTVSEEKGDLIISFGRSNKFKLVKSDIINSLNKLTISRNQILPGIITYGSTVKTILNIGELSTLRSVSNKIKHLRKPNPGNVMLEALDKSKDALMQSTRLDASKTVWLTISSKIVDRAAFKNKIDDLKKSGIKFIFFVSSDVDKSFLKDIVGDKNVVELSDDGNGPDNEDIDDIIRSTKSGMRGVL